MYVWIAKYSKRITLKQKYIIICGYIIPLYSIKIHFFLTLHFQSIRMLHPYLILKPRLRWKTHWLRKSKKKVYIQWMFYFVHEISDARVFPFKDAHLQFRASTTSSISPDISNITCVSVWFHLINIIVILLGLKIFLVRRQLLLIDVMSFLVILSQYVNFI